MTTFLNGVGLFSLISLISAVSGQEVFEYDGISNVKLEGQYNWTLKYRLGAICEDQIWVKTLTIDILATTPEADLIFAFGTQSHYFAVAMGMPYAYKMR